MDNYSEKELQEIKKTFAAYKGKYDKIKKDSEPERWVWSDGPSLSLLPFSVERGRYKPGKILKSEPKVKKNVVAYGYVGGDIVQVMVYGDKMLLKETFRDFSAKDKIVDIGFSHSSEPKTLYEITICYLSERLPAYSQYYMLDGEEQQVVKEVYFWEKGLLKRIAVRGANFFEDIVEEIVQDYAIEHDKSGQLTRILSVDSQGKGKGGKVVFPK